MPLVGPEISCYPEDLLTTAPNEVPGRRWSVAHTMARREKALARELRRCEIPFYLPLRRQRLSSKGRRALSYHPVFAGFVFIYANDQESLCCLATRHVAAVLPVADQAKRIEPPIIRRDIAQFAVEQRDGRRDIVDKSRYPLRNRGFRTGASPCCHDD